MHVLVIFMMCAVDVSHGLSSEATFELGPPGVSLNCILILSRSSIECALRTSEMDVYKD